MAQKKTQESDRADRWLEEFVEERSQNLVKIEQILGLMNNPQVIDFVVRNGQTFDCGDGVDGYLHILVDGARPKDLKSEESVGIVVAQDQETDEMQVSLVGQVLVDGEVEPIGVVYDGKIIGFRHVGRYKTHRGVTGEVILRSLLRDGDLPSDSLLLEVYGRRELEGIILNLKGYLDIR